MAAAACRDADPELFFPAAVWRPVPDAAAAWCSSCPVASDCLAYALDRPELVGVWGGSTAAQRAHLRATAKARQP